MENNRVCHFMKVSDDVYKDALETARPYTKPESTYDMTAKEILDKIITPCRATTQSAGYDFFSPFPFTLNPGETIMIPSGIRAVIADGWFLAIVPRSGLGFKYKFTLDNCTGVIDADYANSANEGHIMLKMTNNGDRKLSVQAGVAVAQGILLPFGVAVNDDYTEFKTRDGGFGSTDKR